MSCKQGKKKFYEKKAYDYFVDYLKANRMRQTRQRVAIVKYFLSQEKHVCTDELYYKMRKRFLGIGHTTVYRTIRLLRKAKMVRENNFSNRRAFFEKDFKNPHHDHLVCLDCGRVIEVVDPKIEYLQEKLAQKNKFVPKSHRLEIYGICKQCGNGG